MQWVADSLKYDQQVEEAGIFTLKDNGLGIKIHHYRECQSTILAVPAKRFVNDESENEMVRY